MFFIGRVILILQPHASSHLPSRYFKYPEEVEVLGQVVGDRYAVGSGKATPYTFLRSPRMGSEVRNMLLPFGSLQWPRGPDSVGCKAKPGVEQLRSLDLLYSANI